MNERRIFFNVIGVALIGFATVSLLLALFASGKFSQNPKTPDALHVIPLTARGMGTVYLTQTEWQSVAYYWDAFYAFWGAFALLVVGRFLYQCLAGFMRGWRE